MPCYCLRQTIPRKGSLIKVYQSLKKKMDKKMANNRKSAMQRLREPTTANSLCECESESVAVYQARVSLIHRDI